MFIWMNFSGAQFFYKAMEILVMKEDICYMCNVASQWLGLYRTVDGKIRSPDRKIC